MASIKVRSINKSFSVKNDQGSSRLKVLKNISLDVYDGEFVSFFGPNACGKTTFLNIVGGLLEADSGSIKINNTNPKRARIGFIFQNYSESLYPWLINIDNVAFPLQLHGVRKKERRTQAKNLLEYLDLNIPLKNYPYQLSAGQQQLLSIARSLVFKVDVLLMDEPFASLDYTTRFFMRDRVQEILLKTKTTTLLVSHTIEEAIYLADRLVLFSQKPMKILKEIIIPFSRPRKVSLLESDEFFRIQARALRIFKEEIAK